MTRVPVTNNKMRGNKQNKQLFQCPALIYTVTNNKGNDDDGSQITGYQLCRTFLFWIFKQRNFMQKSPVKSSPQSFLIQI